jgi:4-hydroxybenzoate polyprenyltransferase
VGAREERHPREIATGPAEARDQAQPDRVATGHEHDGDGRGRGPGRVDGALVADDHGHLAAEQILDETGQAVRPVVRVAILDSDVLTLHEPGVLQAVTERGDEMRERLGRRAPEEPDRRRRRLRLGAGRRGEEGGDQDDRENEPSSSRFPGRRATAPPGERRVYTPAAGGRFHTMSMLRHFLDAIKVEHTIFALPFAYLGMVLAARGWPGWHAFLWITVAMVAARTTAMAANRLIDRRIDARNPRTAGRHLPRGLLQPRDLAVAAVASALVFFLAAWQLGPLCLALSPLALAFLVGYSYTKRFTWLSHWILGFTDGAAAAGAWIAVRGTMEAPAWLLWLAVTVWIAGFDLLYACQDVEFDRREGLHSVPARFGIATALRAARASHVATALALAAAGWTLGLGVLYWVGWLVVVGLLVYEHSLVSATDLSRLDMAFFNVNGYISVITFVAAVAGLWY